MRSSRHAPDGADDREHLGADDQQQRGRYAPRTLADPRPGDVVYFRHSHVGIVVAVRATALTTIEGNASDAVRQRVYSGWRSIADIDGFGRP